MRKSADEILFQHYGIGRDSIKFIDRPDADVVISTTGIFSKAMSRRLNRGDYQFMSLDAASISRRRAHFSEYTISKGLYGYVNGIPMPARDVSTVATTAYLVTRAGASPKLVLLTLSALYDSDLTKLHPDVFSRYDAKINLSGMSLHETARDYYYPFDVDAIATLVEAIAGTKELVVALGAGIFLLWGVRRRNLERKQAALARSNRDHLSRYVDQTLEIEKTQIRVKDPERLEELLEQVTQVKLRALDELADDEVRGDRMFSIFLLQCANLINNVQLKIIRYSDGESASTKAE
jgi:hypothetical protein